LERSTLLVDHAFSNVGGLIFKQLDQFAIRAAEKGHANRKVCRPRRLLGPMADSAQ